MARCERSTLCWNCKNHLVEVMSFLSLLYIIAYCLINLTFVLYRMRFDYVYACFSGGSSITGCPRRVSSVNTVVTSFRYDALPRRL
jgi:hypothetical protein